MSRTEGYWEPYVIADFDFTPFSPGSTVLDVGSGSGEQLAALRRKGCQAVGVEPTIDRPEIEFLPGVRVVRAMAEELPFPDQTFDGAICKVVTSFTDEPRCVAELGRVVKPGGVVVFCHSGLGYYLRYVLRPPRVRVALYGARTIANTVVCRVTAGRVRWLLGPTAFQSPRLMRRYYSRSGFAVRRSCVRRFLGAPVFMYDVVERRAPLGRERQDPVKG